MDPIIDLYVRQISSLRDGLAVWNPDPGTDGAGVPRPPICPGDVGYFEDDGTFTLLFNLHRGDNKAERLPEGFQLLEQSTDDITRSQIKPQMFTRHSKLAVSGKAVLESLLPVKGGISLASEYRRKASLQFFEPGWKEKCINIGPYETCIRNDGLRWFEAAQRRQPSIRLENVILVTGCTRVRSWAIKVVDDRKFSGDASLAVDFGMDLNGVRLSTGISWEDSPGVIVHAGPGGRLGEGRSRPRDVDRSSDPGPTTTISPGGRHPQLDDETVREWSDQSIFIRGFRLKARMRGGIAPRKLKAAAGPPDLPPRDNGPGEGAGMIRSNEEDDSDSQDEETITPDHMQAILDYILQNSDVEIAIAHEDDLLQWVERAGIAAELDNGDRLTAEDVIRVRPPPVQLEEYNGVKFGVISITAGHSIFQENETTSAAPKVQYRDRDRVPSLYHSHSSKRSNTLVSTPPELPASPVSSADDGYFAFDTESPSGSPTGSTITVLPEHIYGRHPPKESVSTSTFEILWPENV